MAMLGGVGSIFFSGLNNPRLTMREEAMISKSSQGLLVRYYTEKLLATPPLLNSFSTARKGGAKAETSQTNLTALQEQIEALAAPSGVFETLPRLSPDLQA